MDSRNYLPLALVIDDEASVLETFKTILEGKYTVVTALTGQEALNKIEEHRISLVFLDLKLPDIDGIDVLKKIKEYDESISVVVATAFDSARIAVKAMQLGSCDYIVKPFDVEEVLTVADKALERSRLFKEVRYLRHQKEDNAKNELVGQSKEMRAVYDFVSKVSKSDATVFICGESGTGKELVARAIHYNSSRRNKPFIPINCAGIPSNLLESELFGYEKGAFTDASQKKLGMFELANEGTIFLDEVSELKADMQVKLLRVIEEKEIRRLGGIKTIKLNIRIVSATNADLKQAVKEGKFREDLYYRLNIIPFKLPPLRERKEDIPLLLDYFIRIYNRRFRKDISGIDEQALDCLLNYHWPGNIRELKNIVERFTALKDKGLVTLADIPLDIFLSSRAYGNIDTENSLKRASDNFQKQYIEAVLEKVGGSRVKASKILGIHRNALLNKIKAFGVDK